MSYSRSVPTFRENLLSPSLQSMSKPSKLTSKQKAKNSACWCLVLVFDLVDGGNMFLRGIGRLAEDYTMSHSGRKNFRRVMYVENST
jgi:hypothetical protein